MKPVKAVLIFFVLSGISFNEARAGVAASDYEAADLMISEVQHFPQKPLVGETLTFTVFVKNLSKVNASDVTVKVKDHRGMEKSGIIKYLPAGMTQYVLLRITADESHTANDPHHFIFMVDPEDAIAETDEGNNIYFEQLRVDFPSDRDLIVSKAEFTPENPKAGDEIVFTVGVKNLGSSASSHVKVVVRDEKGWSNYGFINSIPAGKKEEIKISLRPEDAHSASNPHNFTVSVDPDNAVSELNEDNNLYSLSAPINVAMAEAPKISPAPAAEPAAAAPFWARWTFQKKEPEKKELEKKEPEKKEPEKKEEPPPVAEAYMPPVDVLPLTPPAVQELYFGLEEEISGIEGSPDIFQKGEVESMLQQLAEEAKSRGIYVRTELGEHFNRWYQYPHNRTHRENTLKALGRLKKDLRISGTGTMRAGSENRTDRIEPAAVEVRPQKEPQAAVSLEKRPAREETGLTEDEEKLSGLLEDLLSIPIVSPVEVMQDTVKVFDRMAIRYGMSEPDRIVLNAKSILNMGAFYESGTFYKRFKFKRLMSEIAEWEQDIAEKIRNYSFRFPDGTSEDAIAAYKKKVIVLSKAFEEKMLDVDLILRLQMEVVEEAEKTFLE